MSVPIGNQRPDKARSPLRELEGEYELVRELGRGGMAVVYLARQRQTGAEVAVKIVHAKYVDDSEALARFEREARMVSELGHPNVVKLYGVRPLADASVALIMQYVPGRNLKQAIRDARGLPFAQVERVLGDIAEALEHAHRRGIVHRDVKPENIFLDESTGQALLSDFGIARSIDSETHLTITGTAIGTPAYMSPEQIDGGDVDGRSDLYSLALVGWEMVTGHQPWEGEGLYGIIYKQKREDLPPLDQLRPDVPPRLRYVIEGALRKDRKARWQSAEQFRMELLFGTPPDRKGRSVVDALVPGALASLLRPRQAYALTEAKTVLFRRQSEEDAVDGVPAGQRRRVARIAARVGLPVLVLAAAVAIVARGAPDAGAPGASTPARDGVAASGTAAGPASNRVSSPAHPADSSGDGLRSVHGAAGSVEIAPAPLDEARRELPVVDAPDRAPADRTAAGPAVATAAPRVVAVPPAIPAGGSPAQVAATTPGESAAGLPAPAAPRAERVLNPLPTIASRIVTGGMHSCSLAPDGTAYCWGGNDRGQLGAGSLERVSAPARVAGGLRFSSLAAGVTHTCGVDRDGDAYCWGANDRGQLGDGTLTAQTAPSRVLGERPLRAVSAGMSHSCALAATGNAYCWGANAFGQLGDGTRATRSAPVLVAASARYGGLATGWNHTCAVSAQGAAFCWGQNAAGQLGDGTQSDRSTPTAVTGGIAFRAVAAGSAHTCGITAGGDAYCWGRNTYGQIGDGTTTDRSFPVKVQSTRGFTAITAGTVHTCGLTRDGEVLCWGRNSYGQLGDGSTSDRTSPVPADGAPRLAAIHASGAHTCGTTASGVTYCWGYNVNGQLGDGTRTHRTRPTGVQRPGA